MENVPGITVASQSYPTRRVPRPRVTASGLSLRAILECYVIIDLKTGKLTHQDLGQLQLYVNYYDRERRTEGDNPSLGLILCADTNDTVVKYTLGPDQQKKIFASRYKLHLPTEAELKAEIRRELKMLS